ncbi:Vacuolar membrane-associated protein IML1 [Frankliniella fusca]|uniref:Vacuolar membrane-associated protein IML1 n=1 Tax=Frankliniella fusca TaxID=407009 RepID=A0AAE1IYA4_9NEOP|nr:Vacuolar membrane-associated protein IML1 [Frankliniella fusca]
MVAMAHKKTVKKIDQKFLVPGHTHLECDSDHALIEEKKKQAQEIHVPRDWFQVVRRAMKRKVTAKKEKFVWRDVVWLQHRRDLPTGIIGFKKSFNDEEEFSYLDMRRKRKVNIVFPPLQPAQTGPNRISSKKKAGLLSMLHLIDPDCHAFYHSLATDDARPEDEDPDIFPDSDIEDSEEEE